MPKIYKYQNHSRSFFQWSANNKLKIPFLFMFITSYFTSVTSTPCHQLNTNTVPCGKGIDQLVPVASIPYVLQSLSEDCGGVDTVTLLFNELNAAAYAADYCSVYPDKKGCDVYNNERLSSIALNEITLDLDPDLKIVQEGYYRTASKEYNLMTGKISFCVGVALTGEKSPTNFLGHFNAENIKAFDIYLKGGQKGKNPFQAFIDFIGNHNDWRATLLSGSEANLVYMKTLLKKLGVKNIKIYSDPAWKRNNQRSLGSLVIQGGKVFRVKHADQFHKYLPSLSSAQKNKPLTLNEAPIVDFNTALFHASKIKERDIDRQHKKEYRQEKGNRQRQVRRHKHSAVNG